MLLQEIFVNIDIVMRSNLRKCCDCGKEKLLTDFHKDRKQKYGRKYYCKECYKIRMKDPERIQKRREYTSRPEVRDRLIIKRSAPKTRIKKKEYDSRPENKEKKKLRDASSEYKKWRKEYLSRPEIKKVRAQREKLRRQKISYREYAKEYNQRAERRDQINKRNHKIRVADIFNIPRDDVTKEQIRWYTENRIGKSSGESKILLYLQENNIAYVSQKSFPDCKLVNPLHFDFYLPEQNLLIEYNGRQHYETIDFFGGAKAYFKTVQKDQIKMNFAKERRIDLLIIPYNREPIKILKKKLKALHMFADGGL